MSGWHPTAEAEMKHHRITRRISLTTFKCFPAILHISPSICLLRGRPYLVSWIILRVHNPSAFQSLACNVIPCAGSRACFFDHVSSYLRRIYGNTWYTGVSPACPLLTCTSMVRCSWSPQHLLETEVTHTLLCAVPCPIFCFELRFAASQ